MNLSQLKTEIYNLGFTTPQQSQGSESVIISAINRAMSIITCEVRPIIASYTISYTPKDGKPQLFDMAQLTMENNLLQFLGFSSVTILENGAKRPLTGFEIENYTSISLNLPTECDVIVYYNKLFTPITTATPDSFEIELASDVCVLLPLLCGYYALLDDDERKATIYFNSYMLLKQGLTRMPKKPARVICEEEYRAI